MPELADRPLLDTDRDSRLFVGRELELRKLLQATELGLNTLLLAEKGMGKTSLLRHLGWELRQRNRPFVNVSGAMASNAREFVDMVAWALGSPRQEHQPGFMQQIQAFQSGPLFSGKSTPVGRPDALVREIRALGERLREKTTEEVAPPPVVLVDDAVPAITHSVFGRARDEMWNLPVAWVVAGDTAQAGEYLRPPTDSFFGRTITLPSLTVDEVRRLLMARAGDALAPPVIDAIAGPGEGNPRAVIRVAQEVLLGERQTDDVLAREQERHQLLENLGPPARRLYEVLASLGSASVDPRLLARLDWSRSRAGQVFAELENAGLVTSATEKQSGVGRPRKVYRIA
ncbi:MAG: ATP-binding protein [Candidatus Dormibacteraeota bacterium]|nr:ATP-binding protein [Candidatus Dormibacteraeota bacterium]